MKNQTLLRLVGKLRSLPGVGLKTAIRYAYSIIDMDDIQFDDFIDALQQAKSSIHFCKECGDYTDVEVCQRCQTADKSIICVVAEPKDIEAVEKTGSFNGVYHALHGVLDFQKGIGEENIRIKELIKRLNGVNEVIIATNPDVLGEMTATYLARLIKPLGIKVTRLAYGIPMGSEIEYADEITLAKALSDRKEI